MPVFSVWPVSRFGFIQPIVPSNGEFLRYVFSIHGHGLKGLDYIGRKMRLLTNKSSDSLVEYLLSHEDDIALSINDFGELKDLFIELFNREAGRSTALT